MTSDKSGELLFFNKSAVAVGEVERYVITYDLYEGEEIPEDINLDSLWLKIKNIEGISFRAAYLVGPFMLYCDVRSEDYHHSQKIIASADQPRFESTLQAQQKCVVELSLHKLKPRYVWIVDIVSQIIFTTNTKISFEVAVGNTKVSLDKDISINGPNAMAEKLVVTRLTTLDIWNLPAEIGSHKKSKHLVVLTHGLHSNVSADMEYLMEQIYNKQHLYENEQIVVKGYTKNVCQTEKGVKYLGMQLANFIVEELYDEKVIKISFVGHSLGGLVQSFAIAYIAVKFPWFFDKVKPINFIGIASPFLGIVTDNPVYINLLLSFGVIGKTGQDLGLEKDTEGDSALLTLLPGEPLKGILKKFRRRTLYMNAVNDGIVPLYTASLLFLDYDDILRELGERKKQGLRIESTNIDMVSQTDFLSRNIISPFVKVLGIIAPQKFPQSYSDLPKVSFLESMVSTLVPPLPEKTYILDPSSRNPVVIHDKVYSEEDITPISGDNSDTFEENHNVLLSQFTMDRGRPLCQKLEEKIARKWHEGLTWRKVVVALKPDAHNNIIVRRRFANAYGWPVVDHLVDSHFDGKDDNLSVDQHDEIINENKTSQELLNKSESSGNHSWITKVEVPKLFDEGPTGMISTVSSLFESFAKSRGTIETNVSNNPVVDENILGYENLGSDRI